MSRGARARPLLVPVTTILRRPGVRHPLQRQVVLGELRVGETYVPAETPIQLDLVLEAINDGITVSGSVRARYRAECRRCLQPMTDELEADVLEIFERRPVEGETYPLEGAVIDLEQLARDTVVLALPLAPLCADDCAGPAPDLYPALVEHDRGPHDAAAGMQAAPTSASEGVGEPPDGGEENPPVDPRWAPLRQLKLD
ncbi:MAG: hypothetical protein QOJ19_4879 [Acidimicrobiia bacterium]|nr:hypothetical protein [Acidimicrobiia bacterium]